MRTTNDGFTKILPPGVRLTAGAVIASVVLLILIGAISVPFLFESSSILYKIGWDGTLLRSGQAAGLMAGCLVLLQLVWSSRFRFLDRIFSLNNLYGIHRITGIAIGSFVILHPVLILTSEDMIFIPFQFRYWPEFTGLVLGLLVLGIVLAGYFRLILRIPFDLWWLLHRWTVAAATLLLFVHVLFVTDTFERGTPRLLLICAMVLYGLLYVRVKLRRLLLRRKPFVVTAVEAPGAEAHSIRMRPLSPGKGRPDYRPGQFAFLRFKSRRVSREEHHFTIASSPVRSDELEFVVRAAGDWTRRVGGIEAGDHVFTDGPYGLFTHLRCRADREIVMIAGGIGITPMLGMLRHMADTDDGRKVTLLWSNRTRKHILYPEEFADLEKNLQQFRVTHILTEEFEEGVEKGPLNRNSLERLLEGCSRQAVVFLCGPPLMMKSITKDLLRIGYKRSRILKEYFSL